LRQLIAETLVRFFHL